MADLVKVSDAEVEQFKRERVATGEFLQKLGLLVNEFGSKVGPKNAVYRSMVRFLKGNV